MIHIVHILSQEQCETDSVILVVLENQVDELEPSIIIQTKCLNP